LKTLSRILTLPTTQLFWVPNQCRSVFAFFLNKECCGVKTSEILFPFNLSSQVKRLFVRFWRKISLKTDCSYLVLRACFKKTKKTKILEFLSKSEKKNDSEHPRSSMGSSLLVLIAFFFQFDENKITTVSRSL